MKTVNSKLETLFVSAAVAAAVGAIAQPANAISLTATSGQFTGVTGATTIDFEGAPDGSNLPYTEDGISYTGAGGIRTGFTPGQFRAPLGDNTQYLATLPGSRRTIEASSSQSLNYFGLYWGSVDPFNSISFFNGNTQVGPTFSRAQVADAFAAAGFGRLPAGGLNGSTYVNFFANTGESFNRVVFNSRGTAFESDNHAFRVVPTPALLPGLIGMGLAALRKRKEVSGATQAKV
jgi:hypothetical protein